VEKNLTTLTVAFISRTERYKSYDSAV